MVLVPFSSEIFSEGLHLLLSLRQESLSSLSSGMCLSPYDARAQVPAILLVLPPSPKSTSLPDPRADFMGYKGQSPALSWDLSPRAVLSQRTYSHLKPSHISPGLLLSLSDFPLLR